MKSIVRNLLLSCAVLTTSAGAMAQTLDPFTVQLKWLPQSQFAGFYVAKEKGFYKDVGLDVTVKPGGPTINPSQVIASGGADVIVDWMPSALALREKGLAIANIAQVFSRSGMMLTCRKDSGIKTPADFKGHTLGVWYAGNEYPFLSWMDKLGLKRNGGADGVTVLKQGFNVDPLLQKKADCISTMTYNEYLQVLAGGMTADQLLTFKYEDQGVSTLEDGIYATERSINSPAQADKLARFVKATLRGWEYAVKNQDESIGIVLKADGTASPDKQHQTRMLQEVVKLLDLGKTFGRLDAKAYDRTVDTLLAGKSDPVITKKPSNAWTHKIWEAAQK